VEVEIGGMPRDEGRNDRDILDGVGVTVGVVLVARSDASATALEDVGKKDDETECGE
jgi:hypothetical protein